MSTAAPDPLIAVDHTVRLLRPFFFDRDAIVNAIAALTRGFQRTASKEWPLWEEAKAHDLYLHEAHAQVAEFLFGCDEGACRYLRVPAQTVNFWFKRGGVFRKPLSRRDRDGFFAAEQEQTAIERPPVELPATLTAPGIELFLSPHGVGVLSLTLQTTVPGEEGFLREFNCRLSHLRPYRGYPFHLPYSIEHQARPPADAPLEARLGASGGVFTLAELTDFLARPLESLNRQWVQEQCSVYSITRFDRTASFTDAEVADKLRPFLNALAHIEEYEHVGSIAITEQVLNPRHWAAVGSLGAAHLVADQDPPHPFDAERVPRVLYKYFLPYLLSYLQRLTLQRLINEARRYLVKRADPAVDEEPRFNLDLDELRQLNLQAVSFNIHGYFTEVSSREVHNQYYELAQQGLRVPQSLALVQRTLRDAEAAADRRFQQRLASDASKNVEVVAHVQSKVEWLEVFFVSYYATALVYYVTAKDESDHAFAFLSIVLTPLVSGLIAFQMLRPDRLQLSVRHKAGGRGTSLFLIGLLVIFAAWVLAGWFVFHK